MITLHSECHLWTIRDEVRIKATDYGAFRYARSREVQQQLAAPQELAAMAKRDYTERRSGIAILKNSRKTHGRLKDNLKRLEELLRAHRVVHAQWKDATQVLLLFANGVIAHISVDAFTGDILRMVFEKYLVGKLAADLITDAFFTRSHIVLAYNTNQLTVVYLQKPSVRPQGPEKIANMDPRIFHVIIPGPSERKLSRHLCVNSSFDLFVIWTQSSQNEVYPWRPTVRDQDRANIHVFKLKGMQLESISYCWTENDPLCVDFLRSSESQLLTVEQKVSRKGEISAEICSYEITAGKMLRSSLTAIPLGTQICCYAFSPDQEKLFLGTIDRNVCLHDLVQQTTKFVAQIEIIPTQCTWHCDSSLIMIANDRSQFQCFDLALTPVGNQLQSEDLTPLNLLDLSHYFTIQPTLLKVAFSRKPDLVNLPQSYAQTDCFLLLLYEHGPIGCLRFFAGAGMRGDIHNSGLTADVMVAKYLALNQLEKAVNLLFALNWETYGAMCLISLHKIANYVFFRSEPRRSRIEMMSKALSTFTDALSEETKDEFSDQVFDLKRRFFFFLLRKNLFAEAFDVAQDIEDYDLFMDLFNILKADPSLIEYSTAALSQAAAILHEEDRANGNYSLAGDYRSESACSQSTCSDATTAALQQSKANALKNYVPPLPSFKSKVFSAEMVKINIPKPELRAPVDTVAPERMRPPPPPLPDVRHLKKPQSPGDHRLASTATATTSMVNSVSITLASLSMKSTAINTTTTTTTSTGTNKALNWQPVPDQVADDLFTPTTVHNLLPRASTMSMTMAMPMPMSMSMPMPLATGPHPASTRLHYATPALVNEHVAPPRSYQPQQLAMQSAAYQPKFYQHPLVSVTIPSTGGTAPPPLPPTTTTTTAGLINGSTEEAQKRQLQKKPTASILSNSSNTVNGGSSASHTHHPTAGGGLNGNSALGKELAGGRSGAGEKNKVKFSDTVQVAVVPEIPRKEKQMPSKRNGYARPTSRFPTNPRKELADSLPLCHPHDDYLKDFNPISTEDTLRPVTKSAAKEVEQTSSKANPPPVPSIKVVHFGVV